MARVHRFVLLYTQLRSVKRPFDIFTALLGLIVLAPVMLLTAASIYLEDGAPILFTQERVGKGGVPFKVYKFRTMIRGADEHGLGLHTNEGDSRITRVGRWLRGISLDELPQLFNIIRGEMSLVGPRPTLAYQVARYDEFQRRRLLVRPGLTGWAQVNGRNVLTWPERIDLDIWYVEHWSLWLDLRIILRTLTTVLKPEGIYAEQPDEISRVDTPE